AGRRFDPCAAHFRNQPLVRKAEAKPGRNEAVSVTIRSPLRLAPPFFGSIGRRRSTHRTCSGATAPARPRRVAATPPRCPPAPRRGARHPPTARRRVGHGPRQARPWWSARQRLRALPGLRQGAAFLGVVALGRSRRARRASNRWRAAAKP